MTIEELKSQIEKTEKRIASPILDDNAKKAFKTKLEGYKKELEALEGAAKKVEKKAEEKVEKKVEKTETVVKKDVSEIKTEIERLDKKLKNPIIDDNAKKAIKAKLDAAKAELKSLESGSEKTVKKDVESVAKKVKAVAKKVEEAPKKKEVAKKPVAKKPVAKKTTTSVAKKESSPTVMVNGKKLSVEDCKEVLQEWNKSRKKAKSSSKKSRSRSTSTKVSANVVHAIETAIESVPAIEISENPTREINKFKRLVQSGEEFLKAFKAVLGDEYNTIDIKKEFDDVDKLIKSLIKKYK